MDPRVKEKTLGTPTAIHKEAIKEIMPGIILTIILAIQEVTPETELGGKAMARDGASIRKAMQSPIPEVTRARAGVKAKTPARIGAPLDHRIGWSMMIGEWKMRAKAVARTGTNMRQKRRAGAKARVKGFGPGACGRTVISAMAGAMEDTEGTEGVVGAMDIPAQMRAIRITRTRMPALAMQWGGQGRGAGWISTGVTCGVGVAPL
mmetsp:Transcript_44472/g.99592  ORF Transcript_44472/g.99592 Transcript_44472/m.99592 type:complete len:206 (-) Transcript_44472:731-1348(-)